MLKKKVLVTGGAGFIGSNIVKYLINEGAEVTVLDNFLSGYRSNINSFPSLKIIEGDVRDEKVVNEVMQDIEIVFHLAASVGNKRSIDNPILDAQINVLGTLNILEAARKAGVKKIVVSSSAGIFGELKTLPIKEDHPIEPDSPYGCTKLCEEKLCLAYSKLYPIDVVCLRYFNVFGPNQRFDTYGNVIPTFVYRMLHDQPIIIFGDGEQTRDFVHVDDVVQANIKAAKSIGVSGAFNIGSGKRISINRLVDMITKNNKELVNIKFQPERPGDVLHSLADISLASQKFNFVANVDFEQAIHDYVEWAKGLYLNEE